MAFDPETQEWAAVTQHFARAAPFPKRWSQRRPGPCVTLWLSGKESLPSLSLLLPDRPGVFSNPAALWHFSLRRGQLDEAVAAEGEAFLLEEREPGGAGADGGGVGEQAGGFFLLGEGRKAG